MLKAEHITKQYQIPGGRHTVFDAVSGCLHRAWEWRSDRHRRRKRSGKSTLARVLSHVERPDGGRVVSGWSGGVRLREKGVPHCKGQGPACDAERFGVFRPPPERGFHSGGALRLLFHMGTEERKQRCLELLDMAWLSGTHSAVGRMNSPVDSKNGCVLPVLWLPSPNTLSLTSPSADWMSH